MDLLKIEIWKQQWEALLSAPYVILPLLIADAIAAWWLRSKISDGEIRGLRQELAARDALVKVAEERASLQKDARFEVEAKLKEANERISDTPTISELIATIKSLNKTINTYIVASVSLEGTLLSTETSDIASARVNVN